MYNIEKYYNKYSILKYLFNPINVIKYIGKKIYNYYLNIFINNVNAVMLNDPLIYLKEFNGKFYINPRSDLFKVIIKNKGYELNLTKYCRQYIDKNKDFIDAGANVGFYTILASKMLNKNRRIIAIEPSNNAYKKLKLNISINNLSNNIYIVKKVAINKEAIVSLKTINNKEEYSTLGNKMKHKAILNESFKVEKVPSTTVDKIVDQYQLQPGFIKIDVEGAEYLLLKGAKKTLLKYSPIILIEINEKLLNQNKSSTKKIKSFLEKNNYHFFNPLQSGLITKNCSIFCFPTPKNNII